jgi:hypothetical protein
MVTETRRLAFTREEVLEAVAMFGEETRLGLPPGHVTALRVDGPDGLTLCIERLGSGKVIDHAIGASALAALLLRYCRHRGIPIPRRSKKAITAGKDGVVLETVLTPPAPRSAPV